MQILYIIFFGIHFYSYGKLLFIWVWNRSVSGDDISYSWTFQEQSPSLEHVKGLPVNYVCWAGDRGGGWANRRHNNMKTLKVSNDCLTFMVILLIIGVLSCWHFVKVCTGVFSIEKYFTVTPHVRGSDLHSLVLAATSLFKRQWRKPISYLKCHLFQCDQKRLFCYFCFQEATTLHLSFHNKCIFW